MNFSQLPSNWRRDANTKPTERTLQSAGYPCTHRTPNDARRRKKTAYASNASTKLSPVKPNVSLAATPTAGTSTPPPPESEKPKPLRNNRDHPNRCRSATASANAHSQLQLRYASTLKTIYGHHFSFL